MIEYDKNYTKTFHSPGIEPWVAGFLKNADKTNVLDLGCGLGLTGFMLKLYHGDTGDLVGLDISREKLLNAKKLNLYNNLIVADATKMPFRDSVFDLLISIELIHLLPPSIFDSFEQVLKKQSAIVLSMPWLPEGAKINDLSERGYFIYKYLLRGFLLVDLKTSKVHVGVNSRPFRILKNILIVLMPLLKVTKRLEKGYLLVLR